MMATEETITTCANCGKGEESSGDLKACTACKIVKYCNRDCQIAHRTQHKKACKKRAAELHDEDLFNEPPPREDCPICFLPLPLDVYQTIFKSCCGKIICRGCIYAMAKEAYSNAKKKGTKEVTDLCAFCRTPAPSSEEEVKQFKKLMEVDNANAIYQLAGFYEYGVKGMPQDLTKANELWLRAGELGLAEAYHNLGNSYYHGRGLKMDKKKAKHYWELAAMNGDVAARHNLGCTELDAGNEQRAMKHFILSAKAGHKNALDTVKEGFMHGLVTKDEYANTLRAFQSLQDEVKSDDRDIAKAHRRIAS